MALSPKPIVGTFAGAGLNISSMFGGEIVPVSLHAPLFWLGIVLFFGSIIWGVCEYLNWLPIITFWRPKQIPILEAVTGIYEQLRAQQAAIATFAEAQGKGNSEDIIGWLCYALFSNSGGGEARMRLFGCRKPSRIKEPININSPPSDFRFENGEIVLKERSSEICYDNLTVNKKDILGAIQSLRVMGGNLGNV